MQIVDQFNLAMWGYRKLAMLGQYALVQGGGALFVDFPA